MKGRIVLWPTYPLAEVIYEGDISFEDRCETMADLKVALRGRSITTFLLDFSNARQRDEASVEGLRTFIGQISNYPFVPGSRVAMVNAPFEHGAATASMSRALHYATRPFTTRDAAVAWLLAPTQDDVADPVGD